MRTLFAVAVFVFVSSLKLAGQIIPPPTPRAQTPRAVPAQGTGVYLVTFRPGTPASERAAVIQATGARLRAAFDATNAASVELPDASVLARLRNDPRVLSVFENQRIYLNVQGRGGGGGGGGGSGKPKAPENLSAIAVSASQISLSWVDAANNEDGFAIERCVDLNCSNFAEIVRVGANVVTYGDSGLTAQTAYRYRVLAFNAAGNSKQSNIAQATTLSAPPPPPSAPGNLNATAITHSQIGLSWSDNSSDETGFRIERCAGSGCANFSEILPPAGANVVTHGDSGLAAETVYRYRVLAFNAAGNSPYSNIAEATTPSAPPPPPTVPSAPSNLNAAATTHTQVQLSWSDNSSDETGFRIERCAGSGCENFSEILPPVGANVVTHGDSGLTADTVYRYRVLAFNAAGNSPYSNIAEATTPSAPPPPPTVPSAPSSLNAAATTHTQVQLSWSDNSSDETGFRIERCAGSGCENFSEILPPAGANVVTRGDSGLTAETTYRYRVLAFNAAGNSPYSNVADTTTPSAPPPPPTVPSAPSSLNAAATTHTQVQLSWSDNSSDETGFRIERCAGLGCANFSEILPPVGANVVTRGDSGLTAETTYRYRVLAFNAAGNSPYSNIAETTTPAVPASSQVVPSGVTRIGAAPGALNWTGAGVGVAIVDTGLDFAHADLGLQPEVPGVNSFNAFAVGTSCQDIHGHGTHVAGIVGAKNNLIDVVGVAPNSTIYCVNVFELDPNTGVSATDESLIAGLNWILTHANTVTPPIRVVNMSLGREKIFGDDNVNHPLRVAVRALHSAGISVVVAAGNDPLSEVMNQVPAFYTEVIAVASTTAEDGVNGYTEEFPACVGLQAIKKDSASYFTTDGRYLSGTGVTISAPGGTREDLFDFAGSCFVEPIGILSLAAGGGTVEQSGTSMAAPHVVGVVALMWEKEMTLGLQLAPEFARVRIRNNAIRKGTAPLDSLLAEYTFDGEREGVIWAPSALLDAPPPPQDAPPAVTIVSPANNANFSTGASIAFNATATDPEDGNIAASLAWTSNRDGAIGTGASFNRTLSNGNHVITASLVDSGGNSGVASVAISVGSPSSATTVRAGPVTYSFQGTTLHYTVKMVNEFGTGVAGVSIRTSLYEWVYTGNLWFANGVTDSQGNARFQLPNADFGCYVTSVDNATAPPGMTWIPGTPDNNFCRL